MRSGFQSGVAPGSARPNASSALAVSTTETRCGDTFTSTLITSAQSGAHFGLANNFPLSASSTAGSGVLAADARGEATSARAQQATTSAALLDQRRGHQPGRRGTTCFVNCSRNRTDSTTPKMRQLRVNHGGLTINRTDSAASTGPFHRYS